MARGQQAFVVGSQRESERGRTTSVGRVGLAERDKDGRRGKSEGGMEEGARGFGMSSEGRSWAGEDGGPHRTSEEW